MITIDLLDRFLRSARGQAREQGTVYAREGRVGDFTGTQESATAVVRGRTGEFEVALWVEDGQLAHRCTCPSWRVPCKHEIAAASVLRRALPAARGRTATAGTAADVPGAGRRRALDERILAARRETLSVRPAGPPFMIVESPSGYAYRIHLRGGTEGPHGCDCPDFEANRLHTCKHVERVRAFLRDGGRLPAAHAEAASRPRVYLHFGEVIEPRLHGRPAAHALLEAFDERGLPRGGSVRDFDEMRERLRAWSPFVERDALAWLDARLSRVPRLPAEPFASLVPPLPLEPYPFQWTGAEFLARTGRALLADEMGLGKTVQAILAAVALRRAERPVRSVTVVCPGSLRGNWEEEIRKWIGESAVLLDGPAAKRARTIAARPAWLVTHYEQLLRDRERHAGAPPDLLVVDEAQRVKALAAKTARALKSIASPHVFALTGTPLENRLEEAYAIAQLVDQRLLPPLWQIERDHFERGPRGRRVVMYRRLDALRARLAPAFLRRRKEDVALELPERLRATLFVPLHPGVRAGYDRLMSQVARIARRKTLLPADLERIMRLLVLARRACDGPHMLAVDAADAEVPKLAELEDALRELCLGEGRKVVVFSEWTDMTDRAARLARGLGLPVAYLDGGVPVRARPALVRSFTDGPAPAVFVATDAGGLGLNLQAADAVIVLDVPWTPARLEQRIARVHRIGSRRPVQVLVLAARDTIEERILQLHAAKQNVLENLWAADGANEVAAPSGSGALREMLDALLYDAAPAAPVGRKPTTPAGGGIDPALFARVVAAVEKELPDGQRQALAALLRGLADALDR